MVHTLMKEKEKGRGKRNGGRGKVKREGERRIGWGGWHARAPSV